MDSRITVLGLGLPCVNELENISFSECTILQHPALALADVLIGGSAQQALLPDFKGRRIFVGKDIETVLQSIEENFAQKLHQVALCTGDPLFFGLGTTLCNRFGHNRITIVPASGSLQGAAALLGFLPHETYCLSLHGRDSLCELGKILPKGRGVFLLTDEKRNAGTVGNLLVQQGAYGYKVHVLGTIYMNNGIVKVLEQNIFSPEEAITYFSVKQPPMPRVVYLEPQQESPLYEGPIFGLEDEDFSTADTVITKSSARFVGLGLLGIAPEHTVWDLGAGNGTVSVEAARLAYAGKVYAMEQKAERAKHIEINKIRFKVNNLFVIHDSLPTCLIEPIKTDEPLFPPNRIFIGGGLGGSQGDAEVLLQTAWEALLPGGRVVISCILLSSLERCRHFFRKKNISYSLRFIQASHGVALGSDEFYRAFNPVQFLVSNKV